MGSSLKFCRLAEGVADLYPRLGPTMEWDTAAGDAIIDDATATSIVAGGPSDIGDGSELGSARIVDETIDGAIIGMVSGFGTIATGLIVAVRNQQQTTERLEDQDRKLDRITAQTNGLSEIERQDIADKAYQAQTERLDPQWRQDRKSVV